MKVLQALGALFLGLLMVLGMIEFVNRARISLTARPLVTAVVNSDYEQ